MAKKPQPAPEQPKPQRGGSYTRDPATGAIAPAAPAPKPQPVQPDTTKE